MNVYLMSRLQLQLLFHAERPFDAGVALRRTAVSQPTKTRLEYPYQCPQGVNIEDKGARCRKGAQNCRKA